MPYSYSTVFSSKDTVKLESTIRTEEEYLQFYGVVMQ